MLLTVILYFGFTGSEKNNAHVGKEKIALQEVRAKENFAANIEIHYQSLVNSINWGQFATASMLIDSFKRYGKEDYKDIDQLEKDFIKLGVTTNLKGYEKEIKIIVPDNRARLCSYPDCNEGEHIARLPTGAILTVKNVSIIKGYPSNVRWFKVTFKEKEGWTSEFNTDKYTRDVWDTKN